MKTAAFVLIAGLASAAAADVMTFDWTVGDTGNNDGLIEEGESAMLTLWAAMDPDQSGNGGGYAGSIFGIFGTGNWGTGTVDSYSNLVDSLGNGPGTLQGNNDILGVDSFQLPSDFEPNFDSSNPIAVYAITWTPNSYAPRDVSVTSADHQNFSVYTSASGTSVEYDGMVNGLSFRVVPAPASLALLGLGGLVARRRR